MGVGLFVGAWVARYLGPESFGLLSYVRALIALLGPIALLGLPGIVLRELVNAPEKRNEILGTAFMLHLAGGLAAWGLLLLLVANQRPGEPEALAIALVLGVVSVFQSTNVVKQVFEAKVQSKYVVWLENGIVPLIAGSKITLILLNAPLIAFAGVITIEAMLVSIGLLLLYQRKVNSLLEWRFRRSRAISLLNDSWPIIISGFAIVIYMSIDKVMLGKMVGDASVGLYSAATLISGLVYFVPTVISMSVFPSLANARKTSIKLYHQRLQRLLSMMVLMAVCISLSMTFLSGFVVRILFGADYADSSTVLSIHIWASIFVFIGVAGSKFILLENLYRKSLFFTLLGAITNIVMNLYLIPRYGINGCAVATLVSFSVTSFLSQAMFRETRPLFIMKFKALLLFTK